MLKEALIARLVRIDNNWIEFLSCDFKRLFGTALLRDSFEQSSQFLRV